MKQHGHGENSDLKIARRTMNLIVLFLVSLIFFVIWKFDVSLNFGNINFIVTSTPEIFSTSTGEWVVVKRVVDGDTIELIDGRKLRYVGVNTPESVDPRQTVQCFGKEASTYNKELVLGKKIKIEKDISDTDRFGRLLRFVYLEDGTFINLKLVEDGYASVMTYPPDVSKSKIFVEAERKAREAGVGLWGKCK